MIAMESETYMVLDIQLRRKAATPSWEAARAAQRLLGGAIYASAAPINGVVTGMYKVSNFEDVMDALGFVR